jgi:hypothetical protein
MEFDTLAPQTFDVSARSPLLAAFHEREFGRELELARYGGPPWTLNLPSVACLVHVSRHDGGGEAYMLHRTPLVRAVSNAIGIPSGYRVSITEGRYLSDKGIRPSAASRQWGALHAHGILQYWLSR